jgi:tetratricopeptide (TPR) repeat protein
MALRRALAIDERSYGAEHPSVATALSNLAQLLQDSNRLAEAEPLMRRALAIDEQSYGVEHPRVAIDLNNLAQLLQAKAETEEHDSESRTTLLGHRGVRPGLAISKAPLKSCNRTPQFLAAVLHSPHGASDPAVVAVA